MKHGTETTRLWLFLAEGWDGDDFYLDAAGNETAEDNADTWRGTDTEARREAERRGNSWEAKNNALLARITMESRGRAATLGG